MQLEYPGSKRAFWTRQRRRKTFRRANWQGGRSLVWDAIIVSLLDRGATDDGFQEDREILMGRRIYSQSGNVRESSYCSDTELQFGAFARYSVSRHSLPDLYELETGFSSFS